MQIINTNINKALQGAIDLQAIMEIQAKDVGEHHPLYSTYKQCARDIQKVLETIYNELSE